MTSAVLSGKKGALCRYFISSGTCVFGDDCQFLHQSPAAAGIQQQRPPFCNGPSGPITDPAAEDPQALNDNMANNGDQFFNATFGANCPITEFPPMLVRQRARARNSFVTSLSQGAKPFLPSVSRVDQNLANNFSALNLTSPTSGQEPSPSISEYVSKSSSGSLTHSSSSPSFSSFSQMSSISTPSPHIPSALSTKSPSHSPGISPSNSPLLVRRTESPAQPLRQTPVPVKSASNTIQENVGGTTYFYSPEDFTPQYPGIVLPNYTYYPGLPSHIAHMKVKSNMPQFFMPDEIKMELLNRHTSTLMQIDPAQNPDIPAEVDNYHQLFPLEPPPANPLQKSSTFSFPTSCYKAVNTKDGLTYCLRRIHGFRLANTKCMMTIDTWKKLYHPNVVQLKEVFTTKAFGDNSLIFVYDFHPGSETLMSRHFSAPATLNGLAASLGTESSPRTFTSSSSTGGSTGSSGNKGVNGPRQHAGLLPESLIWAYIVQLSSALRAIHAAGLACRAMDPTKILMCSKSRLRINCIGIFDVLTFDHNQTNPVALIHHYQQDDLISLGKVVLALACNSVMGIQRENLQASIELVTRNYSADLKNLILYLLTTQNRPRSINDIMPMIGARFYTQLDAAQLRSDVLENELAKEVENGRLFRLMCKLLTILERPEFSMDATWSETGDRYMLKLFRDYVFHQVDDGGGPWIDMAHIVDCLNKLDAGVPEKVLLMSRDEQTMLVCSYADLKQSFESAFTDLLAASHQANFA